MGHAKAAGVFLTVMTFLLRISGCDTAGPGTGIAAPALDVAEWIQGEPHDVTDGAHLYVVEFFATWCPFCQDAIPTVTALQDDFADCGVVVIAVSTEDAETVRSFVASQGDALRYTVAVDNNSASASAYGVSSVPIAFLIDSDGVIVWKGHPGSQALRQQLTDLCGL